MAVMGVNESLKLPASYVTNPSVSNDASGLYWDRDDPKLADQWQVPAYRYASLYARGRVVLDVGCGTGGKLVKYIAPVAHQTIGVDQQSAIAIARNRDESLEWIAGDLSESSLWSELGEKDPDLVLCMDVIEHLERPRLLLERLRRLGSLTILSTPDRSRMGSATENGPPSNPLHIREWTRPEFEALLRDEGWQIFEVKHFAQRGDIPYSVRVRRHAWRLLRARKLFDPDLNMVFVCRPNSSFDEPQGELGA